jgi:hypothetical protein
MNRWDHAIDLWYIATNEFYFAFHKVGGKSQIASEAVNEGNNLKRFSLAA